MKIIVTTALLSAVVVLPAAPAAAAPTCQGQAATVVGRPGHTVSGTAGPDVLVSNGASRVETGEGDDLVCVTGATRDGKRVTMDTGPGDDRVRVTGHNAVRVFLGDGDDAFSGGPEPDVVFAGYPDSYDYSPVDTGTDRIRTGAGPDLVRSNGAGDLIELGKGDDTVLWTAASGSATGGRGHNRLILIVPLLPGQPASWWLLDNESGRLVHGGAPLLRWRDFNEFTVPYLGTTGEPVRVRGSAADEVFDVSQHDSPQSGPVTIRAGGGDDAMRGGGVDDTLVGGPGRDTADGGAGEDRCVAEVRERCERR